MLTKLYLWCSTLAPLSLISDIMKFRKGYIHNKNPAGLENIYVYSPSWSPVLNWCIWKLVIQKAGKQIYFARVPEIVNHEEKV